MRLELAGSLIRPDPLIVKFEANGTFDTLKYTELGFTHFEIICIGGGGGMGGGIDTANTGTQIRSYGGAGGGGGFHQVRGLLSALPATCAVVVGQGGALGNEDVGNPAVTTNGGAGGTSSFNTNTCRASGGEGGKRVQTNSEGSPTQAHGGAGGSGNRTAVGGGAAGGVEGNPSTAGTDGTFINNVGKGGGGGAGGSDKYGVGQLKAGTAGGRGSYNPGDTSVYGPGGVPNGSVPGKASGAKAAPLNGLPTIFGQSGNPGVVIIRLTVE